ncbi:hypothetical protein L9F63_012513 [Diploptera punctata]|uniref:Large ribosomal subunit protein mL49 n=1 Tax=Diploptera punctata TaxID=6984 RepID=A0AAD8ENP0_DIPPU|nr:hypothetical protein L9F63_012513 [Diploptera punctata]
MASREIINRCIQIFANKQISFLRAEKIMIESTRSSSYYGSKPLGPPEMYTGVEVSKLPEEWKYVERLLPKTKVPIPVPKQEYPSRWVPSRDGAVKMPYFVERTRNHMFPLYVNESHRGRSRTTVVKKVQGNIWLFQEELKKYLEERSGKHMFLRVHEVCQHVYIKGDNGSMVEEWLLEKGF